MIDLYDLKCYLYNTNYAKDVFGIQIVFDELGVSAQNPGGPYYISYYTLMQNYKYIIPDNIIKIFLRNEKLQIRNKKLQSL